MRTKRNALSILSVEPSLGLMTSYSFVQYSIFSSVHGFLEAIMGNLTKTAGNLQLAKALIKAGIAEGLIIKAAAITEYQFRQLRKELGFQG